MGQGLGKKTPYGGGKWAQIRRQADIASERREGIFWGSYGTNSEYAALQEVMLRLPGSEIESISDADSLQFLGKPHLKELRQEILCIKTVFEKRGIKVRLFDTQSDKPNILYLRDLFIITPSLAILARPASNIRAGEEALIAQQLSTMLIPQHAICSGLFEASDAIFLKPDRVIFGYGNRSESAVASELKQIIQLCNMDLVDVVEVPRATQHLLGVLNVVDRDTVIARKIAGPIIKNILEKEFTNIIWLDETHEVTRLQAMNVLTLGPGVILMPDDCPQTQAVFEKNGLEVILVKIKEIRQGAGGLACMTGILKRELVQF